MGRDSESAAEKNGQFSRRSFLKDGSRNADQTGIIYSIDREAGLCGLYASQIMPIGDPKSVKMVHVFEKAMYERHSDTASALTVWLLKQ